MRQLHGSIVARGALASRLGGRAAAVSNVGDCIEETGAARGPRRSDVMPKTVILDPQGQAIVGALGRLGVSRCLGCPAGQAFRARGRRQRERRDARRDRRVAARQHRHRGLDRHAGRTSEPLGSASSPSPARSTTSTPPAPCGWPARSRSACGTPTPTSRAWTRSSFPAGSPTATTCAAARSPSSRR